MRSTRQIIRDGDFRVAARPAEFGYHGQVLVTNRRYTEPIVLFECGHNHRTERTALLCADVWVEGKVSA